MRCSAITQASKQIERLDNNAAVVRHDTLDTPDARASPDNVSVSKSLTLTKSKCRPLPHFQAYTFRLRATIPCSARPSLLFLCRVGPTRLRSYRRAESAILCVRSDVSTFHSSTTRSPIAPAGFVCSCLVRSLEVAVFCQALT